VRKANNLPPSSADVTESGSLNLPEPAGLHRPVTRMLYHMCIPLNSSVRYTDCYNKLGAEHYPVTVISFSNTFITDYVTPPRDTHHRIPFLFTFALSTVLTVAPHTSIFYDRVCQCNCRVTCHILYVILIRYHFNHFQNICNPVHL
jgi:hypothetical protein